MAEEIRLSGSFRDDITPKLRKLNREINAINKSFSKLGAKIRPVTKEMGKLAMATDRVANNLADQRKSFTATTQAIRSYTTASRKAASQQKKLGAARPAPMSRPRGGGAPQPGGTPGGLLAGGAIAGGAAFGGVAGSTISGYVQQGIMRGFDYGTNLLKTVFGGLASAIEDGIQDEMSDIQSAGGLFALDKKLDPSDRLFKNFLQARNMQEDLNRELAKSAAALPGATSDYVQASKQLTDTVMGSFVKDQDAFAGLAKSLGTREGATQQEQITKVLSRFTEQSVLLGQGQKGGMPLGMLLEQLITQEQVNVSGMKRRYAQLRQNPLLANMLEEAQEAMNASGAGTAERFKTVMEALDRALPQEVVNSMRRSVDGVREAIRSSFLDQEVGLLGLRRPLSGTVAAINEFGQFVDKNGKVVESAAEAAQEQTTVFKLIRDIIAGFGLPISEIAGILPQIFDPLQGMADSLMGFRDRAVKFSQAVNEYTNWFKQNKFEDAGARGALAGFSNLLASLGVISQGEFLANAEELKSGGGLAEIGKRIIQQVIESPLMNEIGTMLGSVMGQVVSTLAKVMTGGLDAISKEGGFVSGFAKAWEASGGTDALKKIFGTIFDLMLKAVGAFVMNFPGESFMLAMLALAPAFIAGFSAAVPSMLMAAAPAIKVWVSTWLLPTIAGWLGAVGPLIAKMSAAIGPALMTVKASLVAGAASIKAVLVGGLAAAKAALVAAAASIKAALVGGLAAAKAALTAFVAPVLAVTGAVLGLVAVFRHMDYILSSFGHAIVMVGNLLESGFLTIIGNILKFVGNIPGMGGLKDKGQAMLDKAAAARAKAGERMEKINENTAKSLQRTAGDFEKFGNFFKGRGFVSNEQAGIEGGGFDVAGTEKSLNNFTSSIDNFFQSIPVRLGQAFTAATNAVKGALNGLVKFFTQDLPNGISLAIDYTVQGIKTAWSNLVKFFVDDIPYGIGFAIGFAVQSVKNVWANLVNFFTVALPTGWNNAINFVKESLMGAWSGLVAWFQSLPSQIMGFITSINTAIQGALSYIGQTFLDWVSSLASIPARVGEALGNIATAIINWVTGLPGRVMSSFTGGLLGGQQAASQSASASYNGNTARTMPLGDAIATENKNKPAGSHLVIANSSESITPANKDYIPSASQAGGGGGPANINMGGVTVNVSGVDDPKAIANQVAEELLYAIRKNTYTELFMT